MSRIRSASCRVLSEGAMRTQGELEATLRSLGWALDGPRRTPSGWKATIQRGDYSILITGSIAERVLEDLLLAAQEHARAAPS
jgi:hypothetical protein